ncbi:Crp/Fnr family transcriptional regulator [Methylobacterium sp. NEAU 140]|uniref:Crp/Fnr family transcriptional regulator n=1 Tax=Methylobacterium sp. NEAU 140 TaxID=3064945 RepID=UPI0027368957|nr:Crp/Fnr family transcriptional regulator [Methylobacterium sp. NEAU 140]MDP4021801.1 Crp/Fnr family transcriptional regulator [Methylobacterium sp. NEAU 140]
MPSASASLIEGNLLLRALRASDQALLAPHLEPAVYAKGATLFEAGSEVTHITFPVEQTVVTLLITTRDGRSAETATIGHEGAVGGVVSQGRVPASTHAVAQIGGLTLRIEAGRLQEAKRRSPAIDNLLARYSDCLLAQILQASACNALHPIEQRCLRWLLTLQDRIGGQTLPITHELLAAMLGVQRTYLTRILRTLQEQGLIRVGRGRITVLDRRQMEGAACECHGRVRDHFEMVLGAVYAADGLDRLEPPPAEGPGGAPERRNGTVRG